MIGVCRGLVAGSLALAVAGAAASPAALEFVRVQGDQLLEGERPFRFISFNIPNLHLVEDHVPFGERNPWRWPDRFEIADALESVRQQGGQVVRTYVLSVRRPGEGALIPRHVLGPGQFDEAGFRTLDLVLAIAREKGVRVMVPFVDNWSWWGGIAEYAGFRGLAKEAFWSDPGVRADFKATVRFLVTRRNTVTGVLYRDDPTVLCWETGNELQSPVPWTREIAAFIKSLDPNHPVMDGYHTTVLREESLSLPEVDIVTTHHYPGGQQSFAELIRANRDRARGRKPYVVGEFGFVETAAMADAVRAVIESGASGALAWSLRFRSRDGGFYWHSEPAGGNRYKAFHWPGFGSGAAYDEIGLMGMLHRAAFEIRGLPMAPIPVPAPPRMLPASDAAHLSWQGSAGATHYVLERAAASQGPWAVVADRVDETAAPHRPLFADTAAPRGASFYRVRAANAAGVSEASPAVGPVPASATALVDELADLSKVASSTALELRTDESRKAREDYHRAFGRAGSSLIYQLGGPLREARLDAFFPGTEGRFEISASVEGTVYSRLAVREVPVRRAGDSDGGSGRLDDYGYWTAVRSACGPADPAARYLRIEFSTPAHLGRVELDWER